MENKVEQTAVIGLQFDSSTSKHEVGLAGGHGWQAVKQAIK